jgi:hypothetical protein
MIDNNHILFERMKKEKFLFFFFFRLCLYRLLVIERQEIMIHWKAFFSLFLFLLFIIRSLHVNITHLLAKSYSNFSF